MPFHVQKPFSQYVDPWWTDMELMELIFFLIRMTHACLLMLQYLMVYGFF